MPSSEGFFSRLTRILTGKKKSPAPPPRSVGAPRPPSRKSAAKKRAAKKRPAKKRAAGPPPPHPTPPKRPLADSTVGRG